MYSPTHLTDADRHIVMNMTTGHRDPVSDRLNAILIRTYGRYAMQAILTKRRDARINEILTQRRWQSTVSRRPQRGRNHDSWSTREHYMTGRYQFKEDTMPGMAVASLMWYRAHPEAFRPTWVLDILHADSAVSRDNA